MRLFSGPRSSAGRNTSVTWFEKVRGHQACTAKKPRDYIVTQVTTHLTLLYNLTSLPFYSVIYVYISQQYLPLTGKFQNQTTRNEDLKSLPIGIFPHFVYDM